MMEQIFLAAAVAVFLGGPYAVFLGPMGRTVLRAIERARDPLHRATPEGAWDLFDRMVWVRLLPMWIVWTVTLFGSCMVGPMMYIVLGPLAERHPLLFFYALIYPAQLAGTWAMAFAGILWWAPRSGRAGLAAKVTATVVGAQLGAFGAAYGLLGWLARLAPTGKEIWTTFALLTLFTGGAAAIASWRRARRLGDAWFEFEEERLEQRNRQGRRRR